MQILEKVSKALSSNYKIKMVFQGTSAYTDGDTITLPSLPDSVDEKTTESLRGYGDHEVGHVKFSDCSPSMLSRLHEMNQIDPNLKGLCNIIEDIRIERQMIKEFPGTKFNMNKLLKNVCSEITDFTHPLGRLVISGRQEVLGYDMSEFADYSTQTMHDFGNDIFERIAALPDGIDGSLASASLAEELWAKLNKREESHDENQPSDNGENKEDGEDENDDKSNEQAGIGAEESGDEKSKSGNDDDSDSDSNSNGNDSGDNVSNDSESDSGSDSDDSNDEEQVIENDSDGSVEDTTNGEKISSSIRDKFSDPIDMFREGIEEMSREALASKDSYLSFSSEYDQVLKIKEATSLRVFNDLRDEINNLGAMKAKISSMFAARTSSRWQSGMTRGRINNRALAGIHTGRQDVFKAKHVNNEVDTAVTFLVDFSGSMSGQKIRKAIQSTILFMEVLGASNVKTEVLGFTTKDSHNLDNAIAKVGRDVRYEYGRLEAIRIYEIKSFSEAYGAKIKRRLSNYTSAFLRNNADADSVKIAARRLGQRREQRKILFVLSDGAPATWGNRKKHSDELKRVVVEVEKSGTQVVGIGFGSESVKKYYSTNIIVGVQGNELAETLTKELRNVLKV